MSLAVSAVRRTALVLVETVLLFLLLFGSGLLAGPPEELSRPLWFMVRAGLVIGFLQLSLYYGELYDDRALRSRTAFVLQLGKSLAATILSLALVYFLFPRLTLERSTLLLFFPVASLAVVSWHSLHAWLAGREALRENVLILGTGHTARRIAVEMQQRAPLGYRVVGFLSEYSAEVERRLVDPSIVGTMGDLPTVVAQQRVNLIVVALDDRRGRMPVPELLQCRMAGIPVEDAPGFFERLTGKILVSNLRPSWLVFGSGFTSPQAMRNVKRMLELALSLTMVAVSAPILLLAVIAIKLDSRGPALYRQQRIGRGGRPFDLLKLRTMRHDAERDTGPVWATAEDDPRITRVGRLLRKTRLDELPQLWNVVRGEMSFVGPRPERPYFVDRLGQVIPYYHERHKVRPGITGWAQVRFGYGSTIEDAENKLQFDLYYIKNMSLLFDFAVVLQTLKVMVLGRGAR